MAHYNFKKDLEDALIVEKEVIEIIKYKKNLTDDDIEICSNKDYDILVKSHNVTIEVKNDLMSSKTGNVGIEFECRGKESGLLTSKADYWIYKLSDEYYSIKLDKLKNELLDNKNYWKIAYGGDYNSNTMMYLVKNDIFKMWCNHISKNLKE